MYPLSDITNGSEKDMKEAKELAKKIIEENGLKFDPEMNFEWNGTM